MLLYSCMDEVNLLRILGKSSRRPTTRMMIKMMHAKIIPTIGPADNVAGAASETDKIE